MKSWGSVLKDLSCWAAKKDHQRKSKEHSQADRAGEVRFEGFGLLGGQNGPPEGEQGAQPSWPSWRGPFWRIWAAERPKRTTRGRARSTAKLARSVLEDLGFWAAKTDHRERARKETKLARSVLGDLGRSADKTDHQRESKAHSQADQAGEVRFEGFGLLSGQNGHQRESKEHSQPDQAGEVRFGGFGLLSGQNGPPEGEQGAQPSWPSWRGPFWRIWVAERPKRTTRGRARREKGTETHRQASSRVMRLSCLCV